MPNLRTAEQAREWLDAMGKSVAEFATEKGLDQATTYQVLRGVKKGKRGEAHRVAVALGMKAPPPKPEATPDQITLQ